MCCNTSGWLYAAAAASVYENDSMPDLSCSLDVSKSKTTTGHGSDVWLLLSANRLNLIRQLGQQKVSFVNRMILQVNNLALDGSRIRDSKSTPLTTRALQFLNGVCNSLLKSHLNQIKKVSVVHNWSVMRVYSAHNSVIDNCIVKMIDFPIKYLRMHWSYVNTLLEIGSCAGSIRIYFFGSFTTFQQSA